MKKVKKFFEFLLGFLIFLKRNRLIAGYSLSNSRAFNECYLNGLKYSPFVIW